MAKQTCVVGPAVGLHARPAADFVRVASLSNHSVRVRIFMAARASLSSSVCPLNSGGDSPLVPLYSGYSSVLKECLDKSKATAKWVGFSFCRMFNIIEINP